MTRSFRWVAVSAWAVPVLVLGQFALLAIVPVTVVVARTARNGELRRLRGWAALLAVAYAVPLVAWAALPDRADSLSKDMSPVLVAVVVAAAVAYAVAFHLDRRAARRRAREASGPARTP